MSKLVYRKQTNSLMVFGGYGSGGQNFEVILKDGENWQECKRNHSPLLAVKAADSPMSNVTELVNFTALHFD